jgi:hypothetical protein
VLNIYILQQHLQHKQLLKLQLFLLLLLKTTTATTTTTT